MRQFVAKLFPFRKSLIPVVAAALTAAGGLSWIFSCPGDYVEPGIWWKLGAAGLLYSSALSAQLLLGRRPGRFVYFAFPPLLAVTEALNFAPPDRFYASQQLGFSLLLAGWFWCLDTAVGEFAARRFRRLAALPSGVEWKHIAAVGVIGGIGFTMSIFINSLSFTDPAVTDIGKISVLITSVIAMAAGLAAMAAVCGKDNKPIKIKVQ